MFPYIKTYEAEQFSFIKVPKLLVTDKMFENLSASAKFLYGLMLDRVSLSLQNSWIDENGNVYIYFTLNEVRQNLGCGADKAVALLAELDGKKGIGLIERKKQGQGKPTIIYVKNFVTAVPGQTTDHPKSAQIQTSEKPMSETAQTTENQKSRLRFSRSQDFGFPVVKTSENPIQIRLIVSRLILVRLIPPSISRTDVTDGAAAKAKSNPRPIYPILSG